MLSGRVPAAAAATTMDLSGRLFRLGLLGLRLGESGDVIPVWGMNQEHYVRVLNSDLDQLQGAGIWRCSSWNESCLCIAESESPAWAAFRL